MGVPAAKKGLHYGDISQKVGKANFAFTKGTLNGH